MAVGAAGSSSSAVASWVFADPDGFVTELVSKHTVL